MIRQKIVSYWETPPSGRIPTHIALCIASMERAFGPDFLLLTPANAPDFIGSRHLTKIWTFTKHNANLTPEVASIVAKSDFVRMAYVYRHGGFWIDADTIALNAFPDSIRPGPDDDLLHWHSEQLFGANPQNSILGNACDTCLSSEKQIWGNPGGVKTLIANNLGAVRAIPFDYVNPGYEPAYNFKSCDVLLRKDIPVATFLTNKKASLLKLYGSDLASRSVSAMSIDEFFLSATLLARMFLHVNPDVEEWRERAQRVIANNSHLL